MKPEDAKAIGAKLTKVQRDEFVEGCCVYMGNDGCLCQSKHLAFYLADGLVEQGSHGLNGAKRTPLGRELLNHLRATLEPNHE